MVRSQCLLAAVWANNTLSVLLILKICAKIDLHATALTVFFEWVWTVTVSLVVQLPWPIATSTLRWRWNTVSVAARVARWTRWWVRLLRGTLYDWWLRARVRLVFLGRAATIRRKSAVSGVAFNVGHGRTCGDVVRDVLWSICEIICRQMQWTSDARSPSRHSSSRRRRRGRKHSTA